jgi:hypothetical protein
VWIGARLAFDHQRQQAIEDRNHERDEARAERDREAARFIHELVWDALMDLQEGDDNERRLELRDMMRKVMRSLAWELSDSSFRSGVMAAGFALNRREIDPDEQWRVVTYLMRLEADVLHRINDEPYELPALKDWKTPADRPRLAWWPVRPRLLPNQVLVRHLLEVPKALPMAR